MAFNWFANTQPPQFFVIQPREQVVGDESPFTGAREIMPRWHQWHVIATWNHMPNTDYWGLFGHLNNSRGGLVLFKVPIFSYRAKRGTKAGTVTLSGAHAAGVTSLTVTGGSGTFLTGDWLEIESTPNNPRAYLVTSSEVAGVVTINPPLRAAESSGAAVRHFEDGDLHDSMEIAGDPPFGAAMPSPLPGLFQPFTLEFVSALRRTI